MKKAVSSAAVGWLQWVVGGCDWPRPLPQVGQLINEAHRQWMAHSGQQDMSDAHWVAQLKVGGVLLRMGVSLMPLPSLVPSPTSGA